MNDTGFEAALRRDGFQEIFRRSLPPGDSLPGHQRAWEVRGLVLRGRFRVAGAGGAVQDCGPGEVFALAPGEAHEEEAGAGGAELVIGRRHAG